MDAASRGEASVPDENPANCPHKEIEKIVINQGYYAGHSNELRDKSQHFVGSQEIKKLKSVALVSGPTHSISSCTQSCSKIVSDIAEEVEAESASPEKEGSEIISPESQSEVGISKLICSIWFIIFDCMVDLRFYLLS